MAGKIVGFRKHPNGKTYPIHEPAGRGGVAALAVAGVVALAGAGTAGAGGAAAVSGFTEDTAMSAAENAVVRNVKDNLSQAKRDAQRGKTKQAWRRLGLRKGTEHVHDAVECAVFSFGEVRSFLVEHPCRGLKRFEFPVAYDGGQMWVAVSEVQFRTASEAARFRSLIDRDGTGDIRPLLPVVSFTGQNYDSDRHRRAVYVAETEASGSVPKPILKVTAEAAVALAPRVW